MALAWATVGRITGSERAADVARILIFFILNPFEFCVALTRGTVATAGYGAVMDR